MAQAKRGGNRHPSKGGFQGKADRASKAGREAPREKTGTAGFTSSALKRHPENNRVPMRGGIRL